MELCGGNDGWTLAGGQSDHGDGGRSDNGTRSSAADNRTLWLIETLEQFSKNYQPVHGYVCLVLCSFGLLTNAVNFVVLTRRNMRSAINMILAAITFCDGGTMSSYLLYVVHFYVQNDGRCVAHLYTRGWMHFILFHSLCSIYLHSSSIWLAVLLAFLRLAVLKRTKVGYSFLRADHVWKLMLCVYLPIGALCIPVIFTHSVVPTVLPCADDTLDYSLQQHNKHHYRDSNLSIYDIADHDDHDETMDMPGPPTVMSAWTVTPSKAAMGNNCLLLRVVLWINGVCLKLLPCLLLAFCIWGLLRALSSARQRNTRVLRRTTDASKKRLGSRTNKMLLVILSIFLITELPQAFVATLSGWRTNEVYFKIYPLLGDLLDLLSLINSGVNFILYCGMSSRFRSTFVELFAPSWFRLALRRRRRRFSYSENELAVGGVTVTYTPDSKWSMATSQNQKKDHRKRSQKRVSELPAFGETVSLGLTHSPSPSALVSRLSAHRHGSDRSPIVQRSPTEDLRI